MASAFRNAGYAIEERISEGQRRSGEERESAVHEELPIPAPSGKGLSVGIRNVAKRFGDKQVLADANLSIREGEFIAIVGRSGCGKSTLLRLIAGLEQTSGGTLDRGGEPVDGIGGDTRFMFQDARLLPWKTVLDNVRLGVANSGRTEAAEQAYEALKLVGLEERAGEWPSVLSGGQRQRVSLARALVGDPRLLLFDEPLGALDALTRIEMQQLIERLWTQRGFTAVLVTHDVGEAVALADRVILIEEGRIALDVRITLARPREKDSGFAHYERLILDRVMQPPLAARTPASGSYEI